MNVQYRLKQTKIEVDWSNRRLWHIFCRYFYESFKGHIFFRGGFYEARTTYFFHIFINFRIQF